MLKDRTQFGAGVVTVKKDKGKFTALVLNAGLVDDSWRRLAENENILDKQWWVFSIPVGHAQIQNNRSVILADGVKGFGFNKEKDAVNKFDSLSKKKIGKITRETLKDKKF